MFENLTKPTKLTVKKDLTASQRLRLRIMKVWEQSLERKNGMDQETYYQRRMDALIALEQQKLEPPPVDPY